ncbi:MAG: hypothetical protein V3T53_04785 [Phycisphaerales bacterium]
MGNGIHTQDRAAYDHNGLNWCIIERSDTPGSGSGLDQLRMMYYSAGWQLCEERIDDDSPFTDDPTSGDIDRHVQYVVGARYIDDYLLHREDNNTDGTYDDTWYHLCDVQYSTVAILDDSAGLVERVSYDAYGDARHHYMADWDGDGDVTRTEIRQIKTIADGADHAIGEANYNPDMDINRNGDVQADDYSIANTEGAHAALAKGLLSDPSVDNQIGWDGYVFNAETRQYCVRNRTYDPIQGRWLERDPLETRPSVEVTYLAADDYHLWVDQSSEATVIALLDPHEQYQDGMNLYEYVASNPQTAMDPTGLVLGYSYGNFCGAALRARCAPNGGPDPNNPTAPIDCLDRCCESHDCCLSVRNVKRACDKGYQIDGWRGCAAAIALLANLCNNIMCVCVRSCKGVPTGPRACLAVAACGTQNIVPGPNPIEIALCLKDRAGPWWRNCGRWIVPGFRPF